MNRFRTCTVSHYPNGYESPPCVLRVCCDCFSNARTFGCSSCGYRYQLSDLHPRRTPESPYLCEGCYSRHGYWDCNECGRAFPRSGSVAPELEFHQCRYCLEESQQAILGYDSRRASRMKPLGNPDNSIYFGVELEVELAELDGYSSRSARLEDTKTMARQCAEALGKDFAICKRDGSIGHEGEGGFEIVTCPASLEVHRERWGKFFRWLATPKDNGGPSHPLVSWTPERCGMHVSVSRKPLSVLQQGKLLTFINEPTNYVMVRAVAGRSSNRWSRVEAKRIADARRQDNHSRYSAVNFQNETHLEVRVFRGTLLRDSFFKNLEFVAASVRFVRWCGCQDLNVVQFMSWLQDHRKEYRHLCDFLEHKKLKARTLKRVRRTVGGNNYVRPMTSKCVFVEEEQTACV